MCVSSNPITTTEQVPSANFTSLVALNELSTALPKAVAALNAATIKGHTGGGTQQHHAKHQHQQHKNRKHHAHITVQHNYHDHAYDHLDPAPAAAAVGSSSTTTFDDGTATTIRACGGSLSFPLKLYEMLERVDFEGKADIVSWQPHGRCLVVHKVDEFVKQILPTYFKLSKIASFQRQLNLYGFIRLTRGPDKGGYYHECFIRGRPSLAHKIRRVKVKGTGVRARANPQQEPDFYKMIWLPGTTTQAALASTTSSSSSSRPSLSPPSAAAPRKVAATSSEQYIIPAPVQPLSRQPRVEDPVFDVDMEPIPLHQTNRQNQEAVDDDDIVLRGWGMKFHYLKHLPTGKIGSSQRPAVVSPNHRVSVDPAGADEILNNLDFDELVNEFFDKEDVPFGDLINRVIE